MAMQLVGRLNDFYHLYQSCSFVATSINTHSQHIIKCHLNRFKMLSFSSVEDAQDYIKDLKREKISLAALYRKRTKRSHEGFFYFFAQTLAADKNDFIRRYVCTRAIQAQSRRGHGKIPLRARQNLACQCPGMAYLTRLLELFPRIILLQVSYRQYLD